jgi:transcriptional antiterminator RfaH
MHKPMACETWYVVQTKPRQEFRARENLERQQFRCLLPLIRVQKLRRGTATWIEEPLFARYLFVELGCADARWHLLRSTRGVTQLVTFGGVPARLPNEWVSGLHELDSEPVPLFGAGERVRVTNGPFSGIEGIFQLADGDSRAVVLLEMLGKPCRAKFALEDLRRVA